MLVGGGSGGHITPLLAVAKNLKINIPESNILYVGHLGDKLSDIADDAGVFDKTYAVRAGKLRRYHKEGWKQLLDLPELFKNIRDGFYFLGGIWQSYWLLRKLKPDVIFIKGGFVGAPIGLAASMLKIPFITHDSDAIPGLANRMIQRWAKAHAVAMSPDVYSYPLTKTHQTGIPVRKEYQFVTPELQQHYKSELSFESANPIICINGGGLGAQKINQAFIEILSKLAKISPEIGVLHICGRNNYDEVLGSYQTLAKKYNLKYYRVEGFVSDAYKYSGAADVIICRAGATSLAEYALQGKACIIVPNPRLTGGHQIKNAQVLANQGAAYVVEEDSLGQDGAQALLDAITELTQSKALRLAYGQTLRSTAIVDATERITRLITSMLPSQKGRGRGA